MDFSSKGAADQGRQEARDHDPFEFRYKPDHSIAKRITSELQQTGQLSIESGEPASNVQCVRALLLPRVYNQEIANSTMSHH